MSKADVHGRPYLTTAQARAGAVVTVDGDFDCVIGWSQHELIHDEEEDGLYFRCEAGRHFLSGQYEEDGDCYVGLYLGVVPENPEL
jgi:hypothetical protein